MVPILSSSEKPRIGWVFVIALFGSELESLAGSRATDITLEGQESVLPRATKMTFIVPNGGFKESFLRGSESIWPPWLLEWCKSYLSFPSQTSKSK